MSMAILLKPRPMSPLFFAFLSTTPDSRGKRQLSGIYPRVIGRTLDCLGGDEYLALERPCVSKSPYALYCGREVTKPRHPA